MGFGWNLGWLKSSHGGAAVKLSVALLAKPHGCDARTCAAGKSSGREERPRDRSREERREEHKRRSRSRSRERYDRDRRRDDRCANSTVALTACSVQIVACLPPLPMGRVT